MHNLHLKKQKIVARVNHLFGGTPEPHKKIRGQAIHTTSHHNGANA
ncbi:hypothetical protein F385_2245 [Pantoea agglomerans 299R]|nr:hypothetical protein F385_2245 [Pantoea agglomerans 299R]